MKRAITIEVVLATLFGSLLIVSAHATDINGAWVKGIKDWGKRASLCSRAVHKENNKVETYENGIVIIDGDEIRGKSTACRIKARKDDGHFVRLLVACPAEIAENLFVLRVDGPDELTRIFSGLEMNTTYFRCPS